MNLEDLMALEFEIQRLFDGAPVDEEQLFAGRSPDVTKMLRTVMERSRHVVLFGERGVGKTSLSNIFCDVSFQSEPGLAPAPLRVEAGIGRVAWREVGAAEVYGRHAGRCGERGPTRRVQISIRSAEARIAADRIGIIVANR